MPFTPFHMGPGDAGQGRPWGRLQPDGVRLDADRDRPRAARGHAPRRRGVDRSSLQDLVDDVWRSDPRSQLLG